MTLGSPLVRFCCLSATTLLTPAIMGDRADVIFADPQDEETSGAAKLLLCKARASPKCNRC
jgi:hypothetical protein